MKIISIVVILTTFAVLAESYSILVLFPFIAKSHWLLFEDIIEELVHRGHKVTAITSFKHHKSLSNYTDILIDPPYDIHNLISMKAFYDVKDHSTIRSLFDIWNIGLETSRHGLKDKNVQAFIKSKNHHFDLIVAEQFFQESWLMFAHKFNVPVVTITTYGYSDFIDRIYGFYPSWATVPHHLLPYEDNMKFSERLHNVFISLFDAVVRKLWYMTQQEKIAQQYFAPMKPANETLPKLRVLERQISAVFINTHRALMHPHPHMPNLIDIGGIHFKKPKPLPKDLKNFMDEAKDGIIYFSFGTAIRGADMSEKLQISFLNVFRRLKQRVLWKWEDDHIPNLPKNVLIRNWFPQHDVLAHKNLRLFITHGGLFSLQESLYNGVPMFVIPFFNDQFRNAEKARRAGYALTVRLPYLTEDAIWRNVSELISNNTYRKRAQEVSLLFQDTLVPPMERAMWWCEYVVRHRYARESLVGEAWKLNTMQYYLVDMILFLFTGLWLVVYIVRELLRMWREKHEKDKED